MRNYNLLRDMKIIAPFAAIMVAYVSSLEYASEPEPYTTQSQAENSETKKIFVCDPYLLKTYNFKDRGCTVPDYEMDKKSQLTEEYYWMYSAHCENVQSQN